HSERGNRAGIPLTSDRPGRRREGSSSADDPGAGRRVRSSPSAGKLRTWRRDPASQQQKCWNAGRSPVNTGASWPSLEEAKARALEIQTKLHQWSKADAERRFDDLYNLVCDPAFLLVGWNRVRGNRGARTGGVDGETARYIEQSRGTEAFLDALRADLKARTFEPLPVRERMIPKPGGKLRRLGIPATRDRVVQASLKLVLEPIFEADFKPC